MASSILKTTSSTGPSILGRLLIDGLALVASYTLNFIVCDLFYHDFNLQQSLKGAYWFFLGPVLYVFGTTFSWVEAWIKALIYKEKNKLKGILENAWHNIDPFDLLVVPRRVFTDTVFSEKELDRQRDNLDYLKSIGRLDCRQ